MRGTISRRGKTSWRLKFDVERTSGKRDIRYVTFRGTRKEAQQKLAELIASVGQGSYVEPSKMSVAAFVRMRVDQFLDPASGEGFQVKRGIEAFHSGGLFGRGPGEVVLAPTVPMRTARKPFQ